MSNMKYINFLADNIDVSFRKLMVKTEFGKKLCLSYLNKRNRLFKSVEIETITSCNRKCGYCPNSSIGRPDALMEDELFYKIIDELAHINFYGRISPHFYGEPLMDKRIFEFIKYIRKKMPKVFIKLFTNGDMLGYDVLKKLLDAGVDVFRISQHGVYPSTELKATLKKISNKEFFKYIEYINYHDNADYLNNRGGNVSNIRPKLMRICDYVDTLTLDYDGNVLLCCQDYKSDYKFGNVRSECIKDIWFKKEYKNIRNKIKCGIWELQICKKCNGK